MADGEVIVTCSCGNAIRMSTFAVGMKMRCSRCGELLAYDRVESETVAAPPQPKVDPRVGWRPDSRPSNAPPTIMDPAARNLQRTSSGALLPKTPFDEPGAWGDKSAEERIHGRTTQEDRCSRCGRPFRGDWDINETVLGRLCHICANLPLATSDRAPKKNVALTARELSRIESTPPAQSPTPIPVAPAVEPTAKVESRPDGHFLGIDTKSPQFKRAIAIAAAAVVGLTILLVLNEDFSVVPSDEARQRAEAVSQSTQQLSWWVVKIVTTLFAFLGVVAPLYLLLHQMDKLPDEGSARDFLYVCSRIAVVFAIGQIPYIGWPIAFFIWLNLLFIEFQLGITDLVSLFVFTFLTEALMFGLRTLVLGIVANLLF